MKRLTAELLEILREPEAPEEVIFQIIDELTAFAARHEIAIHVVVEGAEHEAGSEEAVPGRIGHSA